MAYGIDPDDKLIGSEGNLQDYVDVVLRRGRVVAVVFITIVSVVATYTWTCTPFYTAEARLVLEEKSPTTKDKDRMYGQPEYDQYKGYLATQIEMLKSPTLAEALVGRMNLTEHPEFTSQGWLTRFLTWFSINGNWESSEEDRKSRVANKMLKRLTAQPVKQSNLILVKIDATNRAFAGQLLQNYLDLHLQSNLEKKRQDSLQAAQWLKDELEKADKKLRHAQVALLDFIVDNRIVDSKDGALAEILTLVNKTMEGHVKSQEARAKVQAMDQQNVQEDSAILLPKEVNNEYLGRLKQELAMMESEYTQMRGLYAPNYPKLIMLGKKIKFLRENILTSEKNLVSSALNMAKTEEMLLKGSFDQATKEASR
ncbi:MAG TPA: Wzz/FepE/Etk N-terminal domain-containing protein, partial [Desulfomonilaceae bacterium]|nr:Wzz/FepE/Etk N-terminal domain-containing protein [Desulfomonilaceae bacterium]